MIVKTDAVVLKVQKYLESSAIVTLYTRSFGKISVIAKGARRRQNALAPALGVMNHVSVVVYMKDGRDLQTLSQCDLRRPWRALTVEMERMAAGMTMAELVNLSTHFDERHEDLFDLLLASLKNIEGATNPPKNALNYFEIHFLSVLGFKPSLERCVQCERDPLERMAGTRRPGHANMVNDGVLCPSCNGGGTGGPELSGECIQVMRRLLNLDEPQKAEHIVLSAAGRAELEAVLRWLIRSHVTGTKLLKSELVFSSLSKAFH